MDPVSAVGLAASSLQLASFVFTAALRSIRVVKDLKDVPTRLRGCLADTENSVRRLSNLQSTLTDPNSKLRSVLNQSQLSNLESVVRDGHDATEALHRKLESLFPQQTASSSRHRVKAVWKNVVSLGMEKEVEDAARRIQRLNDEIARELQIADLESQVDLPLHMEAVFRREHEVTRAELRSLRDAVLPVMTGRTQTIAATDQTAVAARLSDTDKSELVGQLCQALMSSHSALEQSCDNAGYLAGKYRKVRTVSRWLSTHNSCFCFKSRKSWTSRLITGVSIEYDLQADHHPACPLAKNTGRSWSYTLSLSLLPLISRTIALSFGARCQGGGWSMSPALKVYATIPRATSPMFRAFDDLRYRLSRTDRAGLESIMRYELSQISGLVRDMMASRTGSVTDRDENNRTILHVRASTSRTWIVLITPRKSSICYLPIGVSPIINPSFQRPAI